MHSVQSRKDAYLFRDVLILEQAVDSPGFGEHGTETNGVSDRRRPHLDLREDNTRMGLSIHTPVMKPTMSSLRANRQLTQIGIALRVPSISYLFPGVICQTWSKDFTRVLQNMFMASSNVLTLVVICMLQLCIDYI